MKGSKETLSNYLTSQIEKNIRNKKKLKSIADYVVNESNLPVIEIMDAITLRRSMDGVSDRLLFWLTKSFDDSMLPMYFSQKEIKEYENNKISKSSVKFPIRWDMVEVIEGSQWVGKITVKQLMDLRNAQLINYNERTQRTLRHVVNKDFEYYQIFLNKKAVNEIIKSFESNQYIPNTITLNLPMNADFGYKDGKLVIFNTDRFDILDGYHRYIAMSNLYNRDSSFDYTMELRVVCFSEETARQFIWQEDQKTKMKKMDSDSFNQNSPAIQVINLINQENLYRNIIGRNGAIIDQGLAANLIDRLYFNTRKTVTRADLLKAKSDIIYRFNEMMYHEPEVFDRPWGYEYTIIAFTLIDYDVPDELLADHIDQLETIMCDDPELTVMLGQKGNPVTTKILTRVRKVYDEYFKQ